MSQDDGYSNYLEESKKLFEAKDVLAEAGGKTSTPFTMLANLSRDVIPSSSMGRTDPTNYKFQDMKFIDSPGVRSQLYKCSIKSKDSDMGHRLLIAFYNVEPGEKPDADINPVRVNCSCLAYYFYYGYYNWENNVHYGPKPRPYHHVPGSKRKSVNPGRIPGTCKHLNALARLLQDSGRVR